jgi:O-antigen ligase
MGFNNNLKSSLSKGHYILEVSVLYSVDGSMQLLYDTGNDFNNEQQVIAEVQKGQNNLQFPFSLEDDGQLRHLRLDFGSNNNLMQVGVQSVQLSNNDRILFRLEKEKIAKRLGFLASVSKVDETAATFTLDSDVIPFDPYVVFDPINELMYPKWQRILLLICPWLVLFILPLFRWLRKLNKEGQYGLFFIGLFIAAIPLKIAWVTFTTLLLLAYAFFHLYKKRSIRLGPPHFSLMLFFAVPLLFLGDGDFSKLSIPFGFVLFALIGTLVDFSNRSNQIKKIYVTVFFIVMSISMVNWLLLMFYNGYFYKISWANYFINIKSHAHTLMYWLYYPHTTFLSFFIIIGALFCLDLNGKKEMSRIYGFIYTFLTLCTLVLLGSRFALLLVISLPFLYAISVKNLSRWLVPTWAAIFAMIVYFIGALDVQREQLWKVTWAAFKNKIWLGHGTGTSSTVLPEHLLINKGGVEALMEVNHSHNQFLTYLLENGLLGALLFLTTFLYLFYQFTRQRNKTMLLVSFMILLLMIIESPFRTTTSLYVIAFLFSIFCTPPKSSI